MRASFVDVAVLPPSQSDRESLRRCPVDNLVPVTLAAGPSTRALPFRYSVGKVFSRYISNVGHAKGACIRGHIHQRNFVRSHCCMQVDWVCIPTAWGGWSRRMVKLKPLNAGGPARPMVDRQVSAVAETDVCLDGVFRNDLVEQSVSVIENGGLDPGGVHNPILLDSQRNYRSFLTDSSPNWTTSCWTLSPIRTRPAVWRSAKVFGFRLRWLLCAAPHRLVSPLLWEEARRCELGCTNQAKGRRPPGATW